MKGVVVDGVFKPFRQLPALPEGYPGPVIRTSTIFYVKGHFGKVTLQRLVSGPFEIWHGVYEAFQDCSIRFHHKRAFLGVHAMLNGASDCEIHPFARAPFNEHQCNFYYLPLLDGTMHLQKGKQYQTLNMCLKAAHVKSYLTHFETGKSFREKLFQKLAAQLHSEPVPMSFALKSIIDEILSFRSALDQQDLFLRIKIHEFLFYLFGLRPAVDPLKPALRNSLEESRNYIEQHFTEHLTIRQLARKAGMNTTTFKAGFKKAFGMAPFEYLVDIRMQHALELLRKRDLSIQRIADASGYKSFGSFIKAFKRKFGMTPGQIKKTFPSEP